MEYDGTVYCCDHFVFPEYRLGNIRENTFIEMMGSERQLAFGAAKHTSLPDKCRGCRWLFACHGECPKNRIAPGGVNYLCEGYRRFFEHVAPYMDFMRDELAAGRPAFALVSATKALEADPGNMDAMIAAALANADLQEYDKAIKHLNEAAISDASDPLPLMLRAWINSAFLNTRRQP